MAHALPCLGQAGDVSRLTARPTRRRAPAEERELLTKTIGIRRILVVEDEYLVHAVGAEIAVQDAGFVAPLARIWVRLADEKIGVLEGWRRGQHRREVIVWKSWALGPRRGRWRCEHQLRGEDKDRDRR